MSVTNQVGLEVQVLLGIKGWVNSVVHSDGTPYIFGTDEDANKYYDKLNHNGLLEYRVYPSLELPEPKIPCTRICPIAENEMCKFCILNNGNTTK